MPTLVHIVDYQMGDRTPLGDNPITIGRLSKNDIAIKHKQVSRQHAKIAPEGPGRFVLEDLNSTNFVYINRKQTQREPLKHGDLINVGGVADFLYLDKEDPELALKIIEKLKNDPEYSPANFALKKTMASLMDELSSSQVSVTGEQGPLTEILKPPVAGVGALADIESLYEIAYTINSSIDLNETMKIIVNKVLEVTRAERGFVMLKPADRAVTPGADTPALEVKIARTATEELTGTDRESYSQTIVQKAIETGETYVSTNAAEDPITHSQSIINYAIREAMCAPLRVKDDTIGTIYVDTRQVKGNFSKRDVLFFEAICHQAAVALANARMAEDLKAKQRQLEKANADLVDQSKKLTAAKRVVEQKVRELSALNAVANGINVTSNLDSVLRLIVDKTVEVLNAEWGCLMLANEDEDTLFTQVTAGETQYVHKGTQRLADEPTIFTECMRREQLLSGVRNEGEVGLLMPMDPAMLIVMAVPLVLNKRKLGVIAVINPNSRRGFTKEEEALASTLASQAAVTIENARLYNLAIYDGLTGLHLRRYFDIWLKKEFDRVRRYGGKLSLVMIDVDHFKHVNDEYGHQCGDEVLRLIGALVRDSIRSVDLGARYGGEEFSVILPETDTEGANLFAERLRARVEETPIRWDARAFPITISCGIATYIKGRPYGSPEDLIETADKALYQAKSSGRNKVVVLNRETGTQPALKAADLAPPKPAGP